MLLDRLSKELPNPVVRYDNFIILGDFDIEILTVKSKNLNSFMKVFSLENLVKTPTGFKAIIHVA